MTKTNMVATLPIEAADLNVAASATAAGRAGLRKIHRIPPATAELASTGASQ